MNPASRLTVFFVETIFLAWVVSFSMHHFLQDLLPIIIIQHRMSICFSFFFFIGTTYRMWLHPAFINPLRNLPTIRIHYFTTATENPRGKSFLKWMRKFPEAELIHMRSFGNSAVIASGPSALRDILNTHSYDFEKPWGIRAFLARVVGWGLLLSEGDLHRRHRKAITPCFNIRKIRDLYDLMWEKTGILLSELEKTIEGHPNNVDGFGRVEMAEWASRLTLDVIGPTAMGRDFQSLTHRENQIATTFLEILDPTPDRLVFLGLHFLIPEWLIRRLPLSFNTMINTESTFLRETCDQIVREKRLEVLRDEKLNNYDILSTITQTGQFSDVELVDQMLTFLAAGHETTASALTWACYLCAIHPEIQAKLRTEIRENIPSSGPVTYQLLESLPYLHGVSEETQRLYPTVPTTVRETVVDTQVAGQRLPKETLVYISPYAINRHPRFWGDDGGQFKPERWIDTYEDGTAHPNKHGGATTNYAEITFLHGPRACIGREFAKAELRCGIAGVIGKFEIKLQNPGQEPIATGIVTVKPAGGMHLLLKSIPGW